MVPLAALYFGVIFLTGFRLWRQYWRQYWGYIFFGGIFPSKMGRFAPFQATIQALSNTCVFLFNSSPAIMPLAALYFGVIFFGGISPSKIGEIAPFLATIQRLSKTWGFLFNKRSEGCFV
jgi:hypothetical protein